MSHGCRLFTGVLFAVATLGCASTVPLARNSPVAIYARGEAAEIDAFATAVSATLNELSNRLGLEIPATGLGIHLFASPWEMRNYLRRHCPEQAGKAAACFSRQGEYVITVVKSSRPGRTERMLRHELTHYFLASHYGNPPTWIDEGLAQYFEVAALQSSAEKSRDFRRLGVPSTDQAVAELTSLPAGQPLDERQYLLSWALVSFLLSEDGIGIERIKSYLADGEVDDKSWTLLEPRAAPEAVLRASWRAYLDREELSEPAPRRR